MNTTERQERYETMLQQAVESRLNGMNRRTLLRNGAVAGGAMLAFGSAGSALAQGATPVDATPPAAEVPFTSPIDVLNYALTLEHIENAFYRDGLPTIGVEGITGLGFQESVFDFLNDIAAHESAHVTALTDVINQLGGTPVQEGTYTFPYTDAASFLSVALSLEDTGLDAYTGAAQYLIDEDELLTTALTIHAIEGRHAAYLALLNAQVPYPVAFEEPLLPSEVQNIVSQFIQQ